MTAAHEAILMLDADGRVVLANAHAARLAGAPLPPGTPLREVLPDRAGEILRAGFAGRAAGLSDRYELALQDSEGRELWLLVSGSPMLGPGGKFLGSVAVLTDITAS